MEEYLILVHQTKPIDETPEELKALMARYEIWADKLIAQNRLISGQRLSRTGRVILDKNTIVSDGPFLESKEIIGGYMMIRAESLEAAAQLASDCPIGENRVLSVRPMYEWEE